ncbi:hypothetical protein EV126DRAFT_78414 [Verticillium dahliae]|nr:hypothetical protein EV126DRAFT_78414 [Verticillium dahliae]
MPGPPRASHDAVLRNIERFSFVFSARVRLFAHSIQSRRQRAISTQYLVAVHQAPWCAYKLPPNFECLGSDETSHLVRFLFLFRFVDIPQRTAAGRPGFEHPLPSESARGLGAVAASEDNGTRAQDASERTPNVIASLESLRDSGRNIGAAVVLRRWSGRLLAGAQLAHCHFSLLRVVLTVLDLLDRSVPHTTTKGLRVVLRLCPRYSPVNMLDPCRLFPKESLVDLSLPHRHPSTSLSYAPIPSADSAGGPQPCPWSSSNHPSTPLYPCPPASLLADSALSFVPSRPSESSSLQAHRRQDVCIRESGLAATDVPNWPC